jgi:hypothetical protein
MTAAKSAGIARPNVRWFCMENLTFIQIRHRADNSLSPPTQKADTAKMIAAPGLAVFVQADMVTPAAGEKTRSIIVAAVRTVSRPSPDLGTRQC